MYIIVFEAEDKGWIMGGSTFLDMAEKTYKKINELSIEYGYGNSHKIIETTNFIKSYNIRNKKYLSNFVLSTSDGCASIYIVEIGKVYQTIDSFIAFREFPIELFK